ncbi:hypothetical protein KI387_013108, partial [Taxus chinensis]
VCLNFAAYHMERLCESDGKKSYAKLRLHKVSGHMTEILELHAETPTFHILFIPGNPGIISFYRDYLEVLYELLDQKASVTAIGHVAHTSKDWEDGKLFSLQEQISHKVDFIKEQLLPRKTPIILVGHSIGAYISLDIFKAFPEKVSYMIGMYPFLTLNRDSKWQSLLTKLAKLPIICAGLSSLAGLMGLSPTWFHRGIIESLFGHSWSSDAVHVACTYLLRLQENPDWTFIRGKENQIAFLFGSNDHWGPLSLLEE